MHNMTSLHVPWISNRHTLRTSWLINTPFFHWDLVLKVQINEPISQFLHIFLSGIIFRRCFYSTNLSSTKRDPFFTQHVSRMASCSIIISSSLVSGGNSTLTLFISPNFFFSNETWKTGWIQDSSGNLSL